MSWAGLALVGLLGWDCVGRVGLDCAGLFCLADVGKGVSVLVGSAGTGVEALYIECLRPG